ncbi:MAG: nucleotidyltransferase family protein [Pseudomonadales bacterium]|nr:nucleotidyltransferase family protein [Pseudomonadales bacterium]
MRIGALVLAAGQSKRFGGDKRQATLPNGKLVIQQTLEKVTAVFDDVLVVLRAEDAELHQKLLNFLPDLTYHHAPDSELGMGNSLASGIRQISDWDGVFVFLADMPFVEVATLSDLVSTAVAKQRSGETSWIIVPGYKNKPGHPVGFSSDFFDELAQLSGDKGAKSIINNHQESVVDMADVDDPGVLQDIDQEKDLRA